MLMINKIFKKLDKNKKIYRENTLTGLIPLDAGIRKGYIYVIGTVTTHPVAYVIVDKDSWAYKKEYADLDLPCHGGATYSQDYLGSQIHDNKLVSPSDERWVIGWDYAHSGDKFGVSDDEGKEYSMIQIMSDVYITIDYIYAQEDEEYEF